MDTQKIKALITLLDDPSEEIFNTVENELLKAEVEIVPELEKIWETQTNGVVQYRLENIIHTLQFRDVKKRLAEWKNNNGEDLLTGVWLVAKYQYPELTFEEIDRSIEKLRKDIWLELNEHLTALEKVRVINHILFDVHGFSRNNSNFLSPQNSFICDVLDTRKGNPISLSVIYAEIAQRLGLPIYGVNLPKNYILAYLDEPEQRDRVRLRDDASVLFYINPINKGAVLGRREIEQFIKQQKLENKSSYFIPCSNIDTVKRILNNLLIAYQQAGQVEKFEEVKELMSVFAQKEDFNN
ncbi:transglutaminase-like domain-containing protein [Thermophagus xiamenensis]|jgi:regulator of sirC expression with transglutaminase-like and TPR domain|uniref:Transglutaminase-like superfamily protein n=1 Tax=Thermophagus xiamenensis TaxID=385682 RepID=A0A1I1VSY3_9BACT|nr:transglutaminase-like domain-containing protein [Thermophagus xiamenensis]SFD85158.1 Transglutaminase-like superfamily protein [Thermophagus xiamenensis]